MYRALIFVFLFACCTFLYPQEMLSGGIPSEFTTASLQTLRQPTPVAQKSKLWCWAASLQMIMDYGGVTMSQDSIVNYYNSIYRSGYNCPDCNSDCNTCRPVNTNNTHCNFTFNLTDMMNILPRLQINSTHMLRGENINILRIQNTPYICLLSNFGSCTPRHATVGYSCDSSTVIKWVDVIDPNISSCNWGYRRMYMDSSLNSNLDRICNYFVNITSPRFSISRSINERRILEIKTPNNIQPNWENVINQGLTNREFEEITKSGSYNPINTIYLSFKRLRSALGNMIKCNKVSEDVVEVLHNKIPFNSTFFYRKNDQWRPFQAFENRSHILSALNKEKPPFVSSSISYILRISDLDQEYLAYTQGGTKKILLTPVETYELVTDKGLALIKKEGQFYSEKEVIRDIKIYLRSNTEKYLKRIPSKLLEGKPIN
jgi:hypothetical protein